MTKSFACIAAALISSLAGCAKRPEPPTVMATPPKPVAAEPAATGMPAALAPVPAPTPAPALPIPVLRIQVAFPGLKFDRPLFFTAVPGEGGRVCVVEQKGRVWFFKNEAGVAMADRQLAVDLTDTVLAPGNQAHPGGNEEGLLGLAFDPDFSKNKRVFLHYSLNVPKAPGALAQRRNRLSYFVLGADGTFNRASERVLLEVDQPEANHNGGMIAFGPDGMLYVGLGDGGGAGDKHGQFGNGQKTDTLLGKILRLDTAHAEAKSGKNYGIPADNPFVGKPGFSPEIWALGLRNPWRFSFDRQGGELWCGDVGQNAHEEIDLITRGGNYGWRVREGRFPYAGKEQPVLAPLIEPLADHDHRESLSVTGGYVYRGRAIPALDGWYVYGDFVTGNLWRLKREADGVWMGPVKLPCKLRVLASFGEDAEGELHLCAFDGRIYRLTADADADADTDADADADEAP